MRKVPQHTAANLMIFMTDSTDLTAGKTGLTLTVTLSKDGAAFASISPTVTERGNGWYNVALVAGNTDTIGDLIIRATGTGAVDAARCVVVQPKPYLEEGSFTGTPSTTSQATTSLAAGTANDHWKNTYLSIVNGSGAGQVRKVTASSESAGTTTLTTEAFATAPASGDEFVIVNV